MGNKVKAENIQLSVSVQADRARQEIKKLEQEATELREAFYADRREAVKAEKEAEKEYQKRIRQHGKIATKIADTKDGQRKINRELSQTSQHLTGQHARLKQLEKEKEELLKQGHAENSHTKQVNADIKERLTVIAALEKQRKKQQERETEIQAKYKEQSEELEKQNALISEQLKKHEAATAHRKTFSMEGERFRAIGEKQQQASDRFTQMDTRGMNLQELGRMRRHVEETMKMVSPDDPQLKDYQRQLIEIIERTKELRNGEAAVAKAHENSTLRLKHKIGTLEKEIALMDRSSKEYKEARKKLREYNSELGRSEKGMSKARQKFSSGLDFLQSPLSKLGPVGTAVAGTLAVGVKMFTQIIGKAREFEQAMSGVKAVTGATDGEFLKLKADAKRLGATTKYTATEVAGLQKEYGKLGFTTDEILNATEATLDLAAATGGDLARSAEIAGSTLRGFGLEATEMTRVTDVMADSFTKSALDLSTFAESMKYVGPVAAAAGISIEEATAMLSAMADAGIKGSQAGTSLRRIITDLGAGAEPLSEKLAKLNDKGLTLSESMDEVGRTAQTALLVLSKNTDKVDRLTEAYDKSSGAAKKMADIQNNTLSGSLTRLGSAWEGFLLGLEDGSGWLARATRGVVDYTSELLGLVTAQESSVDAMENERISVNGLVIEMRNVNTTAQRRKEIYDELLKINPELVAGIDLEKISYKQLNRNLEKYNRLSRTRIANEQINNEIDKQAAEVIRLTNEQVTAQRKLNREFGKADELLKTPQSRKLVGSTQLKDTQKAREMISLLNLEISELLQNYNPNLKNNRLEGLSRIKAEIETLSKTYREAAGEIEKGNKEIEDLQKEQKQYTIEEDKLEIDLKAKSLGELLEIEKKYQKDKYAFTLGALEKEIALKREKAEENRRITLKGLDLSQLNGLSSNYSPTAGYSFTREELDGAIQAARQAKDEADRATEEMYKRLEKMNRANIADKMKRLEAQRDLEIKEIKSTKAAEEVKQKMITATKEKYRQLITTERMAVLGDLTKELEEKAAELDAKRAGLSPGTRKEVEAADEKRITDEYGAVIKKAEMSRDRAEADEDHDAKAKYQNIIDRFEVQRDEAIKLKKLEHERSYQEQVKAIREGAFAYWVEHDEKKAIELLKKQQTEEEKEFERMYSGLEKTEEYEKAKKNIAEKYEKEADGIREKFEAKRLQRMEKGIRTSMQIVSAFTDFFAMAKEEELKAAGDNEEKKKEIHKKYAVTELITEAAKIIATTALGVMEAVALSPLTVGLPWSSIISATGAVQLASVYREKSKVMGLEQGGMVDVERAQDGKNYRAKKTDKRGFLTEPSVLVAEEGTEYVIPNAALQNPEIAAFVEEIEKARVSKTLPQMNFERVNQAIVETRAYANGGYVGREVKTETAVVDETEDEQQSDQESSRIAEKLDRIIELVGKPTRAYVITSELEKELKDKQDLEEQTTIEL